MTKRPARPKELPEAVREAVERTVQATIGSAQLTRDRAQEAVDELARTAEAGLTKSSKAVRKRVGKAIDERRPATGEDLRDIRDELRALARRLDGIEQRLSTRPAKKKSAKKGSTRGAARTAKRKT